MSLTKDTEYKIVKRVIILTLMILGIILLAFPNPKDKLLGLVFGVIINLLNFRLMGLSLAKAMKMPQAQIMPYVVGSYMARYIIYGVVLTIAALADYLNFYTVVLGFFMVKIVILSDTFYDTIKRKTSK
ncbi:MAG: ATP synthase subunit I [Senegalia sp. (in: firmicutes)]|uniref:ATP synthase subunit I n=1 Tax=Senegalia sp. (in: firmicutes) TaxID=1924098 RepID=UPI003F9AB770